MWDTHVCTMRITSCGLDRYLVKYIAKDEPTFGLYIINHNEIQQYLETRVIGVPEAAAIQSSHAICRSNTGVIFIDTNIPNDWVRVLRPHNIVAEEDKESEEIYEPAG